MSGVNADMLRISLEGPRRSWKQCCPGWGGQSGARQDQGLVVGERLSSHCFPVSYSFCFSFFLSAYSINFKVVCILIRQGLISAYADGDGPPRGESHCCQWGVSKPPHILGQKNCSGDPWNNQIS